MQRADYEKMRWRATRRGLLEHDLLLGKFIEERFDQLSDDLQLAFSQIVDWDDLELRAALEQVAAGELPVDAYGEVVSNDSLQYQIFLILSNFIRAK